MHPISRSTHRKSTSTIKYGPHWLIKQVKSTNWRWISHNKCCPHWSITQVNQLITDEFNILSVGHLPSSIVGTTFVDIVLHSIGLPGGWCPRLETSQSLHPPQEVVVHLILINLPLRTPPAPPLDFTALSMPFGSNDHTSHAQISIGKKKFEIFACYYIQPIFGLGRGGEFEGV